MFVFAGEVERIDFDWRKGFRYWKIAFFFSASPPDSDLNELRLIIKQSSSFFFYFFLFLVYFGSRHKLLEEFANLEDDTRENDATKLLFLIFFKAIIFSLENSRKFRISFILCLIHPRST